MCGPCPKVWSNQLQCKNKKEKPKKSETNRNRKRELWSDRVWVSLPAPDSIQLGTQILTAAPPSSLRWRFGWLLETVSARLPYIPSVLFLPFLAPSTLPRMRPIHCLIPRIAPSRQYYDRIDTFLPLKSCAPKTQARSRSDPQGPWAILTEMYPDASTGSISNIDFSTLAVSPVNHICLITAASCFNIPFQ